MEGKIHLAELRRIEKEKNLVQKLKFRCKIDSEVQEKRNDRR